MTAARWQVCETTARSCVTSTSARPRPSVSRVISSRIWACTITSRAVVGSSARRTAGCRQAPWRSLRAGASRRRTRAGSRGRARPGCRRTRAARRRFARPVSGPPCRCSLIGSVIWSPIRLTGLNAFIAPWKTMEMSRQRCSDTVSSPRSRMFSPRKTTRPATLADGGQQAHDREDRRRLAAAGFADEPEPLAVAELEAHALDGMQLAAALELEPDVEILDLENGLRHSESSLPSSGRTRKRLTAR